MTRPLLATLAAALLATAPLSSAGAQGGAGGIPAVTPEQTAALTRMATDLARLNDAVTAARGDLVAASLATPRSDAAIAARSEALRAAEEALAAGRAGAIAAIQSSPARLAENQVTALAAMGGTLRAPAARATGGNFYTSPGQSAALARYNAALATPTQNLTAARNALVAASLATPRDDAAIRSRVAAVGAAEAALASARADAFAALQATPDRLAPYQVSGLVASSGAFRAGAFSEPAPLDFDDHEGYVSLFDGVSLTGWDGNPKFWRVENGAIVGESTPQNPSGNNYIAYRGVEAHDFTLKFEIKIEGTGGSGIQYRSRTGLPWLAAIAPAVTANVGPVNLAWMMTGPQADFWPATPVYTGQFYSENTPMRIQAWRGQVVEGYGEQSKRLMGTIGDRMQLASVIRQNDWNQYTVIARGGTFIHIINGQLMAVMVDDDPSSSNNWSGQFGIEIEATTKVSVREIWLKKLN